MNSNADTTDAPKIVLTRTGSGFVVLKSGEFGPVIWTLNVLDNGQLQGGQISENKALIRLAAKDKSATLRVAPQFSVAIAVDRCRGDKASFTSLLTRYEEPLSEPFEAQIILGLEPTSDGKAAVIEFAGASGEQRTVVVPMSVIRDLIPHLEEIVSGGQGASVLS